MVTIPEAGPDSQADAIAAADTVMRAFAGPDLGADEWMTAMYPLLSQTGADAYTGTDPAQIPARQVTGPGTVLPGSTEVSLLVEVPTDTGPYTVTLTRTGPGTPWLAERIRPTGN